MTTLVRNLHQSDNHFASIYAGTELTEAITTVIQYCKEYNIVATLEFNGYINRIESWMEPKELVKVWYANTDESWYNEQRLKKRDNKINEIIK